MFGGEVGDSVSVSFLFPRHVLILSRASCFLLGIGCNKMISSMATTAHVNLSLLLGGT